MSSTTLVVEAITDQPTGGETDPSLSGVRVFLDREAILRGHLSPTLFTTAVVKPLGLEWPPVGGMWLETRKQRGRCKEEA